MQVLLRHGATGHYYNGNGEWVTDVKDARDYQEVDAALDVITVEHLDGMGLIAREGDRQQEYILGASGAPGERPNTILRSEHRHS
jgi:hypothetical protein